MKCKEAFDPIKSKVIDGIPDKLPTPEPEPSPEAAANNDEPIYEVWLCNKCSFVNDREWNTCKSCNQNEMTDEQHTYSGIKPIDPRMRFNFGGGGMGGGMGGMGGHPLGGFFNMGGMGMGMGGMGGMRFGGMNNQNQNQLSVNQSIHVYV